MSQAVNHFCRFGEFSVDRDQKVLLRNDSPVPLAPKVFDTLLILVDDSGRIVTKEELMSRLWPDTFVEESNLTFNIQQLRKALGDNARQPRFIETVPRRGYRFIAEVNQDSTKSAVTSETVQSAPIAPQQRRSPFLWLGPVAVLLLLAVVIVVQFARNDRAATLSAPILSAPFKSEKLLNPGPVRAAITPDGKYVAYTNETGGKESIWLRQLETSESIQIVPPSDEQYLGLTTSHDGNSLYFVRKTRTEPVIAGIYRVMTFGGIPVKVSGKAEGTVSLSPDDRSLSFIRCDYSDDDFCSLFIIDANGQNERRLLTRKRPIRLAGAQFSPDGRSIAFASGQSANGGTDFRLMMLDLATDTEHPISSKSFFNITSLKWLPRGDSLLFTAGEMLDGPQRIWQVSLETGEVKAVSNDASNYQSISLDKSADRMIATYASNTFHLYIAPKEDLNRRKALAAARTFTFGLAGKIAYAGDDGDIWSINYDGGEQRQLTNTSFKESYPRVSPGGRYIFFTSARSGSNQIWRMNADGSNQIQLTQREGGAPIFVTPDERWVYFLSQLNGTLWKVSTEGTEESQIASERVWRPAISPDGKLAAYVFRSQGSKANYEFAVVSLESQKVLKTFPSTDPGFTMSPIVWEPDNQSFDYVIAQDSQNSLWRQSLADQAPRKIADLGNEDVNDLALSADGKYVGFIRGQWTLGALLIEGLR
jgi:Tol biopolymer transport system component/DNA-binding winged helix-turn-helix (wHTH) protein